MTYAPIMPAFVTLPEEGTIIGRILAGYGELEYALASCVGIVLKNDATAFRILFRTRGEEQRIQTGDAILRPRMEELKLTGTWDLICSALEWCRKTRNQYAHCHWYDDPDGLFFYRLETAAKTKTGALQLLFLHVDAPLLRSQEEHFRYALNGLRFLQDEMKVREGKLRSHIWTIPGAKQPPPRHNPPEKHFPRSLGPDTSPPPEADPLET